MEETMRLENKTVIVTGAGSGLGKAVAVAAAKEGAAVVLADINEDAMNKTAQEIRENGQKALCSQVNVCSQESIGQMLTKAVDTFGQVDALVNCAGIFSSIPFLELTEEDWDRMLDINLKGSFLCSQAFIRQLLNQKSDCSGIRAKWNPFECGGTGDDCHTDERLDYQGPQNACAVGVVDSYGKIRNFPGDCLRDFVSDF